MATREYYCYVHRSGYGQHDHLAGEVIARAARRLGLDIGDRVAQCVGLASHAVPMVQATVQLAPVKGVRERMARALLSARAEMPIRVSCSIEIERRCEEEETLASGVYDDPQTGERRAWRRVKRTVFRRVEREWIPVSTDTFEINE